MYFIERSQQPIIIKEVISLVRTGDIRFIKDRETYYADFRWGLICIVFNEYFPEGWMTIHTIIGEFVLC